MKRVALINDLSGFGKCSLTAAIPVISAMGLQACPLPTAILSAQTGFDSFFFDDYTNHMNEITDEWSRMNIEFDGISSGYLGSPEQIKNVLYFLEKFKTSNNIFLADPVMGDNGKCIKSFSSELLNTMKELTKFADVITPNLTELCLLADEDYEALNKIQDQKIFIQKINDIASSLRKKSNVNQTVIVTGIVSKAENEFYVGNLILGDTVSEYYDSRYTGKSFSGTGDLFASVVTGALIRGQSITDAVNLAMKFLQPAIEEATKDGIEKNHGIHFEKYLNILI